MKTYDESKAEPMALLNSLEDEPAFSVRLCLIGFPTIVGGFNRNEILNTVSAFEEDGSIDLIPGNFLQPVWQL